MKKHVFWVVEVFIWVLVLFMVSGVIMLANYDKKRAQNTYQIFLPDVDGLISGSPVRLMGIQVGHVNQLDIIGEKVYVKFVVTDKNVKIPRSAIATVEFSGLGGSKSLEIYPPTKSSPPSDKLLIAQSPKRIHDSLGLLNDMFDKIMSITYSASRFMDKLGVIKPKEENYHESSSEFFTTSDKLLDKMQNQSDNINNKLKEINKKNGYYKKGSENNDRKTIDSNRQKQG